MQKRTKSPATQSEEFEVRLNHNYTVSVFDKKQREIVFRDLVGEDLELLDTVFQTAEEQLKEDHNVSFEDALSILHMLSVKSLDFYKFPKRVSVSLFKIVQEHILKSYVPKISWLKMCYGMQNSSFANVLEMEKVPMTKFVAMYQIHAETIESMGSPQT